jgi:hypothetical protein
VPSIDTLGSMEIAQIDPRDITWEVRDPTYRVYFWTVTDHVSSEWRITEAIDVHEVIAWAEAQRGERTYELFIEYVHRDASAAGEGADEPGLIRLAGADPTAGTRGGATVTISSD